MAEFGSVLGPRPSILRQRLRLMMRLLWDVICGRAVMIRRLLKIIRREVCSEIWIPWLTRWVGMEHPTTCMATTVD